MTEELFAGDDGLIPFCRSIGFPDDLLTNEIIIKYIYPSFVVVFSQNEMQTHHERLTDRRQKLWFGELHCRDGLFAQKLWECGESKLKADFQAFVSLQQFFAAFLVRNIIFGQGPIPSFNPEEVIPPLVRIQENTIRFAGNYDQGLYTEQLPRRIESVLAIEPGVRAIHTLNQQISLGPQAFQYVTVSYHPFLATFLQIYLFLASRRATGNDQFATTLEEAGKCGHLYGTLPAGARSLLDVRVRQKLPPAYFDLITYTSYFPPRLDQKSAEQLIQSLDELLRPGGALLLGFPPGAESQRHIELTDLMKIAFLLGSFDPGKSHVHVGTSNAVNPQLPLFAYFFKSLDLPPASSSPEAQPFSPPQTHAQITFPKLVEPAPALWQVGDIILNKYQVVGILGEGGMGIVYKVHDSLMNVMAVKRPKPQLFTRQSDKENFIREAETWVKLNDHPHILRCYFVEQVKGIPCLFAEVADGGSLAQSIRARRLYQEGPERAVDRILNIAIQFAWGLHAAHEQGLVHQDIKPANVLLTQEGIVKVSDFGLAKARAMLEEKQGEVVMDQQRMQVSVGGMTPAYCSPEQAARRGVTHKTDIWSWAVSVLEMFTGGVIWKMGPLAAAVLEHAPEEEQWSAHMPEEVRELLRRCLQSKPGARPATMAEIAKELEVLYTRLLGKPYPYEEFTPAEAAGTEAMRLHDQADSFAALGRNEEALATYEQVIQLDPMNGAAHASKGNLLFQQGKYEAALAACEQATRRDPTYPGGYYNKAQPLIALGRLPEALAALEQAIRLSPMYAPAHSDRGSTLHALRRNEDALAACEQAIELDPTDPISHRNKGLVLVDLGRLQEALAACEQALQLDPVYAGAYMVKGKALASLRRLPEALAALEQAVKLDPKYAHAYALKGYVLQNLERYEEALAAYEQAIRLNPNDRLAYYNQALTLQNLGRLEEALAAYEQAIRLDPNYAGAYRNKAVALRDLGRIEEALAATAQAVRLDPTMASFWEREARAESFSEKQGRSAEEDSKEILSRTEAAPPKAGFALILPQTIYQEMVTHVMNDYPHMACGMLGYVDGRVVKHYPTANIAANPKEFFQVGDSDMLHIYSDLIDYDGEPVGYVSYPTSPTIYPSKSMIESMQIHRWPFIIFSLKQYPERPSCHVFTIDSEGSVTEGKLELL